MNLFDACPKILFGEDSLNNIHKSIEGKVMLVTDPYMVESGMFRSITDRLDNAFISYSVFSEVTPDPSIEGVSAGMKHMFQEKPDTLIALGGGSAIDLAKALLFFCIKYKRALMGDKYVHRPFFIAIPTTSGTGSEVTSYSVVTDRQAESKIPLNDPCMIPDIAILCPEYTKTLPAHMVAFTGMDVLTHALEAYVSKNSNSFTDMYAKEAARKTFRYLVSAYKGEGGMKPLEEMMLASTMAGLSFSNSGLGVCHGLAHTIGAAFHLPHGKANSIILPYVLSFNAGLGGYAPQPRLLARYAMLSHQLGRQLGFDAPDDKGVVTRLLNKTLELSKTFSIPLSLKEADIPEKEYFDQIEDMADKVVNDITTGANPVMVTETEAIRLLKDIYNGIPLIGQSA